MQIKTIRQSNGSIGLWKMKGDPKDLKLGTADSVSLMGARKDECGNWYGTLDFAWGLVPSHGVDACLLVQFPRKNHRRKTDRTLIGGT